MSDDKHVSISVEPLLYGEYGCRVRVTEIDYTKSTDMCTVYETVMPLSWAEGTLKNLIHVIDTIKDRQRWDAVAGECDECQGSRMVIKEHKGVRGFSEHCPVCQPKIKAERARTGTPGQKGAVDV